MIATGIAGDFASAVLSGSMLAAIPVAVLAGLVSFVSPCVVPLVPGYLGYVSGLAGAGSPADASSPADAGLARPRLVLGAVLFVLGFSAVFVTLGVVATSLGASLAPHLDAVLRVLGVVVIGMGLAFLGWIPALAAERRWHVAPRAGLWGAPLLGATFGLGWTPCIGPTLAAVLTLALSEGTAARGAILAVAYCVGLGLPFVLLAFSAERSRAVLGWLRRHRRALMHAGGGLLVILGLALATGLWQAWTNHLQAWVGGFGVIV